MTRKLSVLLVLAFFVMSLVSVALAANAKKAGPTKQKKSGADVCAPALRTPAEIAEGSDAASYSKPTTPRSTALGYYMATEVQVGSTEFDWQSNTGRQQRQIVIGTDNRLHTLWINREYGLPETGQRSIFYNGFKPGVTDPISEWAISPIPGGAGYGSISVGPGDSLALATYHYLKTGTGYDTRYRAVIARQGGIFSTTFPQFQYPSYDSVMPKILTCQGIKTGMDTLEGGYMWPSIAGDNNGPSGGNQTIAHVLAKESPPPGDTTGKASLVYYKTLPNAVSPPSTGTCGYLLDSISSNICYDIVASPISNKVAAVYLYPKVWTGYDVGDDDDVVYRESNNLGVDWGPRTTIRSFGDEDSISYVHERPQEVSALYTNDDCLHVLYETYWAGINPADGGHYYYYLPCRIYHWSDCNPTCHVLVKEGRNTDDKVDEDPGAWSSAAGRPPLGQHLFSKISLAQCFVGGVRRLYAVYTLYPDSTGIEGNTYSDRSALPILNGEIVAQGSTDITGSLWGPVKNLSNSRSDGCAAGLCASEQYTNAAPYSNDSLRIQYLLDTDAGAAVQGTTSNNQGVLTNNPVMVKAHPCFTVDLKANLFASPSAMEYPFHAVRNATASQVFTLTNDGNAAANWSSSLVGGTCPVSLPGSGTVPAGCTYSSTITATFGPCAAEGLYTTTIRFTYESPAKTLDIPIEFYVFDSWFLPQDVPLRTASNRMMVNQASQAASDVSRNSFSYFEDLTEDFITDGSLILGNSASNLSWLIFKGGQGGPTASNNFGRLYALSNTIIDSTTFATYRIASGKGTNRDSTVAFGVNWYAAKWVPDSSDFYVAHFEIYKGPKWTANVTGLDVAYATDWDVPSDTSSDNIAGTDPDRQMVYLQGMYSAERQNGFGALAAYAYTYPPPPAPYVKVPVPITGGFAFGNAEQVYPSGGFHVDSVWKYMELTNNSYTSYKLDSATDQTIVMVIAKNYTVTTNNRLRFDVVLAGKRAEFNGFRAAGLDGLRTTVDQAKRFIDSTVCTECGDANKDGSVDISDAVFLIAHIFSGGAAPKVCGYNKGRGDANADGSVDISDVVYLIARIFSGGNPPRCQSQVSAL
jgi:hypothetical protein